MQNSFVEGKMWDHPSKMIQNDQNWEVGSSDCTNKPVSGKPPFAYENDTRDKRLLDAHAATYCNALQHTATYHNTLQHTLEGKKEVNAEEA